MTRTGPTVSNGQDGPTARYVSLMVISGGTLPSTLLDTTDVASQGQIGEVSALTKTGAA